MKARLMHRERDFDLGAALPAQAPELIADLELETLFSAMAAGDEFLCEVAKRAVLSPLTAPSEITYRQRALTDCLAQPAAVRELYAIAIEGLEAKRRAFGLFSDKPDLVLSRALETLGYLVEALRRLRQLADEHHAGFHSEAFSSLFAIVEEELADSYLERVDAHLKELRFRRGVLMSARLGPGNRGADYVLRRRRGRRWVERVADKMRRSELTFEVPPRDEAGSQALGELRIRGINSVANAVAQATDHVLAFFAMLRTELAFYIGCINLHDRLTKKAEPTCLPTAFPAPERVLSARGLYDVGLALHLQAGAVGNDVNATQKDLVMITGANQGGKSTFLRGLGLAQLMTQSGMFVGAQAFETSVCGAVFTHYRREEDKAMRHGKLDEELARMSAIADRIGPSAMLLCNESFSATNELEGSEIARGVVRAMAETGVRVMFVTHLYELARSLNELGSEAALFVRAERLPDGRRTYRLLEGDPLPTSYGADSFKSVFGVTPNQGLLAPTVGTRMTSASKSPPRSRT